MRPLALAISFILSTSPWSRGEVVSVEALAPGNTLLAQGYAALAAQSFAALARDFPNDGYIAEKWVESLVRSKNYAAALTVPGESAELQFWRAQALLGEGRAEEARMSLEQQLQANPGDLVKPIVATLLNLIAVDQSPLVAERWLRNPHVVDNLPAKDLSLFKGQVALTGGYASKVTKDLEQATAGSQFALALMIEALLDLGQNPEAVTKWRLYLTREPTLPRFDHLVARLVNSSVLNSAEVRKVWSGWLVSLAPELRGRLAHALARQFWNIGKVKEAFSALTVLEAMPSHSEYPTAMLNLVNWLVQSGESRVGLRSLARLASLDPGKQDEGLRFLEAMVQDGLGKQDAAAQLLSGVSVSNSLALPVAVNGSIIASERQDQVSLQVYRDALAELSADEESKRARAIGVELHQALHSSQGSHGDITQVLDSLEEFLVDYPKNPASSRLQLGHLELLLQQSPLPAKQIVRIIRDQALQVSSMSSENRERLLELSIALAMRRSQWQRVVQLTEAFSIRYPESDRLPRMLMRRATALFEREQFIESLTTLSSLIRDSSQPIQLRAEASFLQSKVLIRSGQADKAVAALGQIVDMLDNEWAMRARYWQALALCAQNNRADAIRSLNDVIRRKPSAPLLLRSLMLKGECLTILSDSEAQPQGNDAIEAFDAILVHPEVTPALRDEALYRKGVALQRDHLYNQALGTFSEVINQHINSAEPLEHAFRPSSPWYYRAGFEAIAQLLSRQEEGWRAAARIADTLGTTDGDRAAEARKLAGEINLMHFNFGD